MSGHSKWSTIKRKKEATDQARGNLFSKLARAISVAVKTGGGGNPETNYKLRMAIDTARSVNMPKENIERAISKGTTQGDLEEVFYEGFAPFGISVIVEAATDNRNRTSQEIKGLFERGGGQLAGPGAVSFNFEPKGELIIQKNNPQSQMLTLIDLGVEDIEETSEAIEAYSEPSAISELKKKIEAEGFVVKSADLVQRPKTLMTIDDKAKAKKILDFLNTLEDHEDVQKVFANVDIPAEVLGKLDND